MPSGWGFPRRLGRRHFACRLAPFQETTKKKYVDELATATRQGDIHVERTHRLASVRNWLKADLKKRGTNNTAAAKPQQVDEIVDYYVRPEKFTKPVVLL